ncbi:hypothetical protein [Streptomyces cinereospinus]|uniref:Uncharacterized protein n=1 Tax=Streptomyces cinereospinus TaxID=285561 RepID=A0ABV5N2S6_9ACTN
MNKIYKGAIVITGGTGSGGDSNAGDAPVPLWRRPAVMAAATAVAITVIAGWIQQGGAAAVSSLFGDADETEPVVHAKTMEPDFCGVWHLRKEASAVSEELKKQLNGPKPAGSGNPDYSKILSAVRKATKSDLPSGNTVEVTIEGSNGKAAILTGLDVIVQKRSALSGDLMTVGSSCGGGVTARRYVAELDDPNPRFEVVEQAGPGEETKKPIDFPYKVSSGDPEVFHLEGASNDGIVEWKAKLHWVADGKEKSTEISDNGKPFVSFPDRSVKYFFSTDLNELEDMTAN